MRELPGCSLNEKTPYSTIGRSRVEGGLQNGSGVEELNGQSFSLIKNVNASSDMVRISLQPRESNPRIHQGETTHSEKYLKASNPR